MLKLTLPGGRAAWFVAAHVATLVPGPDSSGGGTLVTVVGEPDAYRVLEEPQAIAARLSALLGVEVLTAVE